MRLTTFINESNLEFGHTQMIEILLKECMPYLKDRKFDQYFPTDQLYSGRQGKQYEFFDDTIRTNREPKDTPLWIHRQLDDMFYKKFGIKARSSTLFTTGDKGVASSYGDVFIVFPKGQYTVLWSEDVGDLYERIKHIYTDALDTDYHSFDFGSSIEKMLRYSENEYDVRDYVETQATKEYEKYYGEDTKGGVWTYTFDGYDSKELEKMGVKGRKRDIFIKGFKKEKVKDMLMDRYGEMIKDNLIWSPDISLEDFTDKNFEKYEKEYNLKRVMEVENRIDKEMRDLINTYDKGDVQGAIESQNEVMLSSTHGYCAIEYSSGAWKPIFHFFKEYGYHHPSDIKKKIGQEKWDHFRESAEFDD